MGAIEAVTAEPGLRTRDLDGPATTAVVTRAASVGATRAVATARVALGKLRLRDPCGRRPCPPTGGSLAKTNYSFEKRQRELAKKKKQEEKRQKKQQQRQEPGPTSEPPQAAPGTPPVSPD